MQDNFSDRRTLVNNDTRRNSDLGVSRLNGDRGIRHRGRSSVTEHVVVDAENRYGAGQLIPESDAAGTTDTPVVTAVPFHLAVTWAVVFVETALALTVNEADTAPASTDTAAGTLTTVLEDDSATLAPATGAACTSDTVHEAVPSEASTAFAHVNALTPFAATTAIAAPVAVVGIALASTEAPRASDRRSGIAVTDTAGVS